MKHGHWIVYFITPTVSADRRIRIPRIMLCVLCALFVSGGAGIVRCVWFTASYGYAKIHVYNSRRQNGDLLKTLQFLEKFTETKERELQELMRFEDAARMKFGMNTIDEDIRLAGVGGAPDIEQLLLTALEDPPVQQAAKIRSRIESLLRQAELVDSTSSRLAYHATSQYTLWSQRPSIWPVYGRITSGFGYRIHPFFGRLMFHEGIDIANAIWTPVVATADGIVAEVGYTTDFGNLVKVEHGATGYTTVYAHLRQSSVVEGQVVKRGELLGYVGNSGRSTGPHLHYEVRKLGKYENPIEYLMPLNAVVD